ncbi:unnamed protein product [Meganyctiphanes norvegica]|uniref:Zinc finger E-box-binding homeobox protein zag-1 n=1 Tax=Meganyctiphanes norvegica TaxID=48144 RepID=A0AAV2RLK1_MEGNR
MAGVGTMYAPASFPDSLRFLNFPGAGIWNYLSGDKSSSGSEKGVSPKTPGSGDEAVQPTGGATNMAAALSPPHHQTGLRLKLEEALTSPNPESLHHDTSHYADTHHALSEEGDMLNGHPVSCSVCHKKFANIHRLQRHMISHQESDVLRRFKCDECGKAFKFKHHLKEHKRIHSGEKPFECEHCGKRFSHSGSYSSHMSSKKCQLGRSRNNGQLLTRTSPQYPVCHNKRPLVNNSYLPILPKDKSPTPSDLGYSSPTRPISRDSFLMSPPSMVSPSGLSGTSLPPSLPPGFPQGLPPSLQNSLHQGLSPYHPINALILAAQLHPQYSSLLSLNMSQALNNANQETLDKENREEYAKDEYDDDDREPGELVIKEESREDEEEELERNEEKEDETVNNNEEDKKDLSTIRMMLESVSARVTKEQFEEKVSSATPGTVLDYSGAISDNDLACKLCGTTFNNRLDAFHHTRSQCPRLPDVTSATERYKGHLIEGLAMRLHELAGSQHHNDHNLMAQHRLHFSNEEDSDLDCSNIVDDEETTSDGKKVRVRSHIREEQLVVLRAHYSLNPRPKKEELISISEKIGFPVRVVQVWFQNARARDRREGRSITPLSNSYGSSFPPSSLSPISTSSYSTSTFASPTYVSHISSKTPFSPYYPSLLAQYAPVSNGRSSPIPADRADNEDDDQPLDLTTTKKTSPLASPKHASIYSDSDADSTSLAISYKSESQTPTPNSLNNNISEHKESHGLTIAGLPSLISEQQSKLAQILQSTKLGLPPLYRDNEHDEHSDKRPRDDDSESEEARKRRRDDEGGIFQCDQCDKSFNKQSSLARHKYEHSVSLSTGQRPYKCELCPKAFKHKHHLTEHSRLHTGEKPYQCSKCLKRFSHSGSYSQHMNHRYSYCKPYRTDGAPGNPEALTPLPSPLDLESKAEAGDAMKLLVLASEHNLLHRPVTPLSTVASSGVASGSPLSVPLEGASSPLSSPASCGQSVTESTVITTTTPPASPQQTSTDAPTDPSKNSQHQTEDK